MGPALHAERDFVQPPGKPVVSWWLDPRRSNRHREGEGQPNHVADQITLQRSAGSRKHGVVTLEQDFLRFARTRQPDALARVFDATAPGLLRVALHLAGDPADAEDLVQATFLAAIESARNYDGERPVFRWLTGILANKAKMRSRERARQPDPGRLPARGERAPDEAAADRELDAEVDRALNQLEDPYRETLVLHLRYGLKPAEIADALGRSAPIVRTHLHRGRAMLRRLLPASLLVGALFLLTPTRGLDAVRRAVLGGLLVKKKLALAAVLIALLSVTTVIWRTTVKDGDVSEARAPQSANRVGAKMTSPAEPDKPKAPPQAATSTATTGTLRVRAVLKGTNEEIPHAIITIEPRTFVRSGTALTLPPGEYQLRARHRAVKARVEAGRENIAVVQLSQGLTIRGKVVDQNGRAVPRAWIHWSPFNVFWLAVPVLRANTDGSFVLKHVARTGMVSARAGPLGSSGRAYVTGKDGHETSVELVVSGRGGSVAGTVVGPDGPVPDALVAIAHPGRNRGVIHDAAGNMVLRDPPAFLARTGSDGRFSIDGIDIGDVTVSAIASGLAPRAERIAVQVGTTTGVTLRLDQGRVLEGRVTHADGRAAAGAYIRLTSKLRFAEQSAITDADGRFRFEHLGRGEHVIEASHESGKAKATTEASHVDIALTAGTTLRGRVVDHEGKPLARWTVQVNGAGDLGATQADGSFVVRGVKSPCEVRLFEKGMSFPNVVVKGVTPGVEEMEFKIPTERRGTAWLRGRIDGAQSAKLGLKRTDGDGSEVWPVDREFKLGPFVPGRYDLTIRVPGQAPITRYDTVLRANKTVELGTLRGGPAGRLRIVTNLPTGQGVYLLHRASGKDREVGYFMMSGGEFDPGPLAPGTYRIKVKRPDFAQRLHDVKVVADQTQRVKLTLVPGTWRSLNLHPPAGTKSIAVRMLDPSGALAFEIQLPAPFRYAPILGTGRHVIEATPDRGATIRREIEITDKSGAIEINW